jgi:hypothetical protein
MDEQTQAELVSLLSDRAEALAEIAVLQAEVARLEERISLLVAQADGPLKIAGYGSLVIGAPSKIERFDPDALRELIQSLRETGQGDLADEIVACKKITVRAGGLRITPERQKPAAPDPS